MSLRITVWVRINRSSVANAKHKDILWRHLVRILVYLSLILIETEHFHLLGYKSVKLSASQQRLGTNMSPFSLYKEISMKPTAIRALLVSLTLQPRTRGEICLRTVSWLSPDLTNSYPRRQNYT